VFGTWPTTAAWSNVLPLRIPFLLSRLDDPFMGGNLGGSFSGGSLAVLPTWTLPSLGSGTLAPTTPSQGSGSGTLQITHDPATTNGGGWISTQPPTSGTLVLSGTGTSGITSSVAAASGDGRTVGWIDSGAGSATTAFAAPGDTNIDWSIDILDAAPFLSGSTFVSGTPASWNQGDFAYEGVVDVTL
jgi:hypothetical protein